MAEEVKTSTYGFDHVGLSVRDLASSRKFFCDCLGWGVIGERPDYPAAFVSDGRGVLTLWQVESPDEAIAFDRRTNVGLHHLAIAVVDRTGASTPFTSGCRIGLALSSNSVRSCLAPARRSISSCESRAACGSSLRSILASRSCARRGEAVRRAEEEETL